LGKNRGKIKLVSTHNLLSWKCAGCHSENFNLSPHPCPWEHWPKVRSTEVIRPSSRISLTVLASARRS